MIIQTSNGLTTKEMINQVKEVIPRKAKKAVIITTASPYKERNKHIPNIVSSMNELNLESFFFDFDKDESSLLKDYDVMVINGGNPFYLLKSIYEHKGEDIIKYFADDKVLITTSAGTMILGNTLAVVNEFTPEMNDGYFDTVDIGLNLTTRNIVPHYSRYKERFDDFEQRIQVIEDKYYQSFYRMNDNEIFPFDSMSVPLVRKLYRLFFIQMGVMFTYMIAIAFTPFIEETWVWIVFTLLFTAFLVIARIAYSKRKRCMTPLATFDDERDEYNWRKVGGLIKRVDEYKNEVFYDNYDHVTCDTELCRFYKQRVRDRYLKLDEFLASINVDIEKPVNCSSYKGDKDNEDKIYAVYLVNGECSFEYSKKIDNLFIQSDIGFEGLQEGVFYLIVFNIDLSK